MRNVIVTDPPRAALEQVDELAEFGVATVHEAIGRAGYCGPWLRPRLDGARIGGTAVTALCWPGDNLMIHAAVEQCRPGDVLVVTTTSPCRDGLFGELLATALAGRGVRGAVLSTGVRDVAELRAMGFPVWSAAVSAQGTVKATAGAVNVPVVLGGQPIHPGDAVLADDDGVLCVPRAAVPEAIGAARVRVAKEAAARTAFQGGELSLDRYGLRDVLDRLGVRYVPASELDGSQARPGTAEAEPGGR
jgi:4-hydroxy-4-methyl-2-oxoglutarate aldolase